MVDFTSALYLGWNHAELPSCRSESEPLTLGKPQALEEPPGARLLARRLAHLTGFDLGVVAPSTLHLSLDVCMFLAEQGVDFLVEQGAYPVCRWGLELASARGCAIRWFQHHNPESLQAALRKARQSPVVIADGFCPVCGAPAPLKAYLSLAGEHGGRLIVDDTQALGILGSRDGSGPEFPYGSGGGGSPSFLGLHGENLAIINSLAKAFGAPLACLLGSSAFVRGFAAASRTRLHCTAPSTAAIRAGLHALERNGDVGDRSRRRLFQLVVSFRKLLLDRGWPLVRGTFPVQAIVHPDAPLIHTHLYQMGVRSLLQTTGKEERPRVTFVLNATHEPEDLRQVAMALDSFEKRVSAQQPRQAARHSTAPGMF